MSCLFLYDSKFNILNFGLLVRHRHEAVTLRSEKMGFYFHYFLTNPLIDYFRGQSTDQ